jgi:hypothetical protein
MSPVIQGSDYLRVLLRNTEANPPLEELVAAPGDQPMSSYRHRCQGMGDLLLSPFLEL